eukprot:298923_1
MFNTKRIRSVHECKDHSKTNPSKMEIYSVENITITTSTLRSEFKILNTTAFHDIHQSLVYKHHLFNVNPKSFDLDHLKGIICNQELTVSRYNPHCKHNNLRPPSDAIQITWSALPNITFHIFNISFSDHAQIKRYLLHNIRYDLDLKTLQNILKLSLYYHNLSDHKLVSIVRNYLWIEYHQNKNMTVTNHALLLDILHCKDQNIIRLITKCKQKIQLILSGTVGLMEPPKGFEWIVMAMNTKNNAHWMEMSMCIFPDRQWKNQNETETNKYQFHMFITRNFQFLIHQWLHGEGTTPKLSLWMHMTAKRALNAQHIVSRPIARMKTIMKSNGFRLIENHEMCKIMNEIGAANYECFAQIQAVNDWLISPKTVDLI